MTPLDRMSIIGIYEEGSDVEIDFRDYSFEGPRTLTVRITGEDALLLADAIAEYYGEEMVPKGSIVFTPDNPGKAHLSLVPQPADFTLPECDGYCADCNHTCPNRAWRLEDEDKNTARWCLWASEPLPLGHSHPHQVEGS